MRIVWVVAVAIGVAACVESQSVQCDGYICPSNEVCVAGGCATTGDIAACDGLADGANCTTATQASGTCTGGVCRAGLCGNNSIDPGEVCDGTAGVNAGDRCSEDCRHVYSCGNSIIDPGEQCDDGNTNPADGCDACQKTTWTATALVGSLLPSNDIDMDSPTAVAFDSTGRTYVTDTNNSRVLRIDTDGTVSVFAGTGVNGFSGDGGPAREAQLGFPAGIAVDAFDRVLIADSGDGVVRRVDENGIITTIAGIGGNLGFSGDGGPAIAATFNGPIGIAVDVDGNIFVADPGYSGNGHVRMIDTNGIITTIAGGGGSYCNNCDATTTQLSPWAVAFDGNKIYVVDTSASWTGVRLLTPVIQPPNPTTYTITSVAGSATAGFFGENTAALGAQFRPIAMAVDPVSRDYVIADTFNASVRRVSHATGIVTTIAGTAPACGSPPCNPSPGDTGDGGPATSAQVSNPLGIAFDRQGRIIVVDSANHRVRVITAGVIDALVGTGSKGTGNVYGGALCMGTNTLGGINFDSQGRLVFADSQGPRIWRVEVDGTATAIGGVAGRFDFSGDGGPGTRATFSVPMDAAADPQGRVVVADTGNHVIRRIDTNGIVTTIAGTPQTYGYTGDHLAATSAKLDDPFGVAVDANGNIAIADTGNCVVRMVDTGGTITTVAGNGTCGFFGDTMAATSANLNGPQGVAFDTAGNLYIADTANNRIRKVSGGTITTVAGNGDLTSSGDGGQATSAGIVNPVKVAVDASGRIVIAENGNMTVRRVDSGGVISTIAGNGTGYVDDTGDGGAATSAIVNQPVGVATHAGGVYVADQGESLMGLVRRIDDATGIITSVAGPIDPFTTGPVAHAQLADARAVVATSTFSLVANGRYGTIERVMNGSVGVVAGRYPQGSPTGDLARYRDSTFGPVGGVAFDVAGKIYASVSPPSAPGEIDMITMVDPAKPETWQITPAPGTASLQAPAGLFLDAAAQKLYIADAGHHAIQMYNLADHSLSVFANTAMHPGFSGDGGPASTALFDQPSAITRCPNGDWFVADSSANRVRRIQSATPNAVSTVLGNGIAGQSGTGSPAAQLPVDRPAGLACDSVGNVYVSSTSTVSLLLADANGVVDGTGEVQTIYGAPPRASFPASAASCLTGIALVDDKTLQIVDACTGLLVQLVRQ